MSVPVISPDNIALVRAAKTIIPSENALEFHHHSSIGEANVATAVVFIPRT